MEMEHSGQRTRGSRLPDLLPRAVSQTRRLGGESLRLEQGPPWAEGHTRGAAARGPCRGREGLGDALSGCSRKSSLGGPFLPGHHDDEHGLTVSGAGTVEGSGLRGPVPRGACVGSRRCGPAKGLMGRRAGSPLGPVRPSTMRTHSCVFHVARSRVHTTLLK